MMGWGAKKLLGRRAGGYPMDFEIWALETIAQVSRLINPKWSLDGWAYTIQIESTNIGVV